MFFVTLCIVFIGYSAACLCFGGILTQLIAGKAGNAGQRSAGTELASFFLLGQGVFASIWLLMSLVGWFSPQIVIGILFLCMIFGAVLVWPIVVGFIRQSQSIWRELRAGPWMWQLIAFLTLLMCLAWVTSLGRPFMGDATAFYMALSKVIAASHRLTPLPGYEVFTQIGLQGEMHYAALIALGVSGAAQMFAWPTILAGAVMLLAIGSKAGLGRRGQWIALACVFTSSAVIYLSGDGKVDLFATALGLAAYYWAVQIGEIQRSLALRLTGLFTGFAVIAKFSYVPVLLPGIALLILWKLFGRLRDRTHLGSLLLSGGSSFFQVGLWMVLAILPHLIKNYVLFGNPLAPFSTSGMGWADQTWFGPETTRRIVLTYPFALTFGKYWGQYGNISPLVLSFLPLALLLPKPRSFQHSSLAAITLAALAGLICWVILRPSLLSPRYILATLMLFILLPARAVDYVSWRYPKKRVLGTGIMAGIILTLVTVGSGCMSFTFFPSKTGKYLEGRMSECERDGVYCRAMDALNERTEPGTRVFLAAWNRYWLRPDLLQCLSGVRDYERTLGRGSEEFWKGIFERGFNYMLLDRTTHKQLIENLDTDHLPPWLKIVPVFEEGHLSVYSLEFNDPPGERLVECRQINSPAWDVVAH